MDTEIEKKVIRPGMDIICPYFDEDCMDVVGHFECWVGEDTNDPFPGVCPMLFKGEA